MSANILVQSCSSCHNVIKNANETLECCNQKYCMQCYVTHTVKEMDMSFDDINPVMQKICQYYLEINGLIAMETKIGKEYNNWHSGMKIACNKINADVNFIKQSKEKSDEYQNALIQNCILPLKRSVKSLFDILNNMKNLEILNSLENVSLREKSTMKEDQLVQEINMWNEKYKLLNNDMIKLQQELKLSEEKYVTYQHEVKLEMDMLSERIKKYEHEITVYKRQNAKQKVVKFNYPRRVGNDRKELKLEGKNMGGKRYLSMTEDNSRILISGWSRDVLSYDVTGENCVKIGESLEIEGYVNCVKCCDRNDFVIGTENGYLIKFVSDGIGSYQRQYISQISCPSENKRVYGLSADSLQFSTWWCVTREICYKVGIRNWEMKYEKNKDGEDSEDMSDIVMRDKVACLLFDDKVRIFNIVDDKLQLPSRIIQVGGYQLQIVNDDLIIADWCNCKLSVVNMKSGKVLYKWEMPECNVSGVDVDFNNKVIYVLTFYNPSCLFYIKC